MEELNSVNDNVEVVFLPPNTTSILQPLNQGIIDLVRKIYKRSLLEKFYFRNDDQPTAMIDVVKKVDLYDCVKMLSDAWDYVSGPTISKSWKSLLGDLITCDFDTKNQVFQTEEQICDNVVNVMGYSQEAREKARSEVVDWLKFNDFDRGWEPMSDDQIIESVVKSFQNKLNAKERQIKPKSFQNKSVFLPCHLESIEELIGLARNQPDCPNGTVRALKLFKNYMANEVERGAVDEQKTVTNE